MFRIIELDDLSYSVEMFFLQLQKSTIIQRSFDTKLEMKASIRMEFLNFLVFESYSFTQYCYSLHSSKDMVENCMLSVENFFEWAVIKQDDNGYIWPPPERILNEWMKLRSWMKIILPAPKHAEHNRLKALLKNYNENAEMFLQEWTGKGNFISAKAS